MPLFMVTDPVNTQRASFLVDQLNLISQPSEHCLGSKSSTVGEFCLWASPSPTTTPIRIHLCPMEPILIQHTTRCVTWDWPIRLFHDPGAGLESGLGNHTKPGWPCSSPKLPENAFLDAPRISLHVQHEFTFKVHPAQLLKTD